ncbi:hypothetical protein GYH30_012292 [Glycine max]|nr:hypothetical protein GYH30_012292 [Glycine max]
MTSVFQGDMQGEQKVLVTSSCDHSIVCGGRVLLGNDWLRRTNTSRE